MAIKLSIYLKRTNQTLESWLKNNDIVKVEDFLPRCAFLGLSADNSDVSSTVEILLKNAEKAKQETPRLEQAATAESVSDDEPNHLERRKKKKEQLN